MFYELQLWLLGAQTLQASRNEKEDCKITHGDLKHGEMDFANQK
jgi:hypothetical protein